MTPSWQISSGPPLPEDRPLRIALGTFEIAGFIETLGDAFQRLGHDVTTALRVGDGLFADSEYDLDIGADAERVDWPALVADLERDPSVPPLPGPDATPEHRLRWLLTYHDVFVFVYASFWSDRRGRHVERGIGREFPLLRRLGKRIVSCFVGPDVRHASAFDQERALLGSAGVSLGEVRPEWERCSVLPPLRNVRRAELFADVILSQPNQAGLALRPYTHLFAPLDLSRFDPWIPGREVPRVVHCPSNTSIKGTELVVAAVERLRAEGVAFEFELLHGVQNGEVLAALRDADVVVDQLHLPLHGRLGVEAMASGCALATCDDARWEPFPARRPIVHLDPHDVVSPLRRLLTDRALRLDLAERGLAHVRQHHDHVAVARRIVEALQPATRPLDHHPEFFARHYRLPRGARLSRRARALTAAVVRRAGLPAGVSAASLVERGLL